MLVTLEEAYLILTKRAAEKRKSKGYLPIQDPVCNQLHFSKKQIRDAVTLTILKKGEVNV
jgi:hypothetical protein